MRENPKEYPISLQQKSVFYQQPPASPPSVKRKRIHSEKENPDIERFVHMMNCYDACPFIVHSVLPKSSKIAMFVALLPMGCGCLCSDFEIVTLAC